MNQVFLSLGSNIGNRNDNILKALKLLEKEIGKIQATSLIYETEPWGKSDQRNFYNQVVEMQTTYSPFDLLDKIHLIEKQCGRKSSIIRFAPRKMDIDILFCENQIIHTETLIIPHPLIHERRFVLVPLAEIAPWFKHPVLGKAMSQLLSICEDETKVFPINRN